MCASPHRTSRAQVILDSFVVAILLMSTTSVGQTDFLRAKAFLKTVYPELKGKNLRVTVWDDASFDSEGGMTTFSIGLEERIEDRPNNKTSLRPYLGAFFIFSVARDDPVFKVAVSGPFVNESKLENTRKLVDSHPEWSDSRVVQALKDAGAEYGPEKKDALLRLIALRALEPFLGKLSILSVEFQLRDKVQLEENLPATDLQWAVRVEAHMPGRNPGKYYMAFEPIGGKLILLGRTPPKF